MCDPAYDTSFVREKNKGSESRILVHQVCVPMQRIIGLIIPRSRLARTGLCGTEVGVFGGQGWTSGQVF